MNRPTRKGIPGRPVGFARLASAMVVAAKGRGEPHRTWRDLVELQERVLPPRFGEIMAELIQREGYNLGDPIPEELIRKAAQLRRRSARYRQRKAGGR